MGKGGSQQVGDFKISMTHAMHSNSIDEDGVRLYAGEPAGYLVSLPGGVIIYHAGDTALFGDMKLLGELYKPDIAMLPIGDRFTMGPREAAQAIRFLGVKHVIPMHYATFPVLATEADVRAVFGSDPRAAIMKPRGLASRMRAPIESMAARPGPSTRCG